MQRYYRVISRSGFSRQFFGAKILSISIEDFMGKITATGGSNDMVLRRLDGSTIDVSYLVKEGKTSGTELHIRCMQQEINNKEPSRNFGNVFIYDEVSKKKSFYEGELGLFDYNTYDITVFACDIQKNKQNFSFEGVYQHENAHFQDAKKVGLKPIRVLRYMELQQDMQKEEKKVVNALKKFNPEIKSYTERGFVPNDVPKEKIDSITKKYEALKKELKAIEAYNKNNFVNNKYSSKEAFTAAYDKDLDYQKEKKLDPNIKFMQYFLEGTKNIADNPQNADTKQYESFIKQDAERNQRMKKRSQSEVYAEMTRLIKTGETRFAPGVFESYFPNVYRLLKQEK